MGRGKRIIQWVLLVLLAAVLALLYTFWEFRGFDKRESMDMAQLARNVAAGQGFTTYLIRPLSLWQLEQNGWHIEDKATRERLILKHPDIYNPPLYPLLLAGIFKVLPERWFTYDVAERKFYAELAVVVFDQLCLLASILLVFLWAQRLFDRRVAVTAGWLMLFSDTLWSYSVSGLPTNLLMLLFLLTAYCLFLADGKLNVAEPAADAGAGAAPTRVTGGVSALVIASAVLLGLCFLTRYLAGFFLIPMAIYVARIFRGRAAALWAGVYVAVFVAVITPWLVRNYQISGSTLGIAKYELIDRAGSLRGEALQRSYKPELSDAYSTRPLMGKFLTNARQNLVTNLRLIGTDFLIFFFGVGLMYGFRRPDVARLRRVMLGVIGMALIAMSLIGSDPERSGPEVNGGNLFVLVLPIVMIYGTTFFYLLLDRIRFRLKLTRGVAIGAFVALNVAPMIFTWLPPHSGSAYPYPPYIPPVTQAVGANFEADALACSDLPWAMAWDGARRTVWLPITVDDFNQINDFVAPKGFQFMMLTPYLIDERPQTDVAKGEYKGWASFLRGQLPQNFPLKAYSPLPPETDQVLLADRVRWGSKKTETGESGNATFTVPGMTNAPPGSQGQTNRPAASTGAGAKAAP
jgi:4-amino-4-deoxy-L-arabinose transferase-like glycosyltransferase